MARIRKPAFSISVIIAPALPARTVSGFRIVNVFCISFLFEAFLHCITDLCRTLHNANSSGFHCRHLFYCSSLPAGDNRSSMAHPPAWRRRLSADETDDRLLHFRFDISRSFLFGCSADFTDHHNAIRVLILAEKTDSIDEVRADDWIATNADTGGLANPSLRQLPDRFVGEGSASRHDSDIALEMNVSRHDSDFALPRRNDSRTVGSDETRRLVFQESTGADHIERRNTLGNANDQLNARSSRLHNRICRKRRRHEDYRRVGACLSTSLLDSIEYVEAFVLRAALTWSNTTDDLSSILDGLKRVKCALTASDTLHNQPGVLIYKYAHLSNSLRRDSLKLEEYCVSNSAGFEMHDSSFRISLPATAMIS